MDRIENTNDLTIPADVPELITTSPPKINRSLYSTILDVDAERPDR